MSHDALWPELAARIDGEVQADPVTRMLYAVDASLDGISITFIPTPSSLAWSSG